MIRFSLSQTFLATEAKQGQIAGSCAPKNEIYPAEALTCAWIRRSAIARSIPLARTMYSSALAASFFAFFQEPSVVAKGGDVVRSYL